MRDPRGGNEFSARGIRRQIKRAGILLVATAGIGVALGGARGASALSGAATFWKVDLHEHSAFSGDARADIGLDATLAKNAGYNAVFLTDHDRLSSFQINGQNGNILTYADSLSTKFIKKTLPSKLPAGSSATNEISTTEVHGGTSSLHLAATASTAANVRSLVYATRGMGLRSGEITLDFWVFPQAIGAASGADVSVSLGGDASTGVKTYGYTTADGVSHPGKSTVLVWQLGHARAASSGGTTDVYINTLANPVLKKWNHYVINVTTGAVAWTPAGGSTLNTSSTGINGLPSSDAPKDYDVLAYPKMEASAVSGTADVYFDDYTLEVATPQCPASEFVYRNSLIDSGQFNGSSFAMYPGREMGQNNHSNQFNFDINAASQYYDNRDDGTIVPNGYGNDAAHCAGSNNPAAPWQFSYLGTDNVAAVQATGYPVQDNHPGITDGTTDVVDTKAHGADSVEVRTGADYSDTWDAILQKNYPLIGTYGSDAHEGVGSASPAVFIDAPALSRDNLLHSLFEGRLFMAPANFNGQIIFNLDGSLHPYPARYPVYVPAGQSSAQVHLNITGGLTTGEKVVWYYNSGSGDTAITDSVSGPGGYTATKTIPLAGSFTYVRAAIHASSGTLIANTEPIFFEDVTALPSGTNVHVDSFTPPSGTCSCTIAMTKGITASSYSAGKLNLTLTNRTGTTVDLLGTSNAPSSVKMDGAAITEAASLTAYQAATNDAWFHDSGTNGLYLRDKQSSGSSSIVVALAGGANTPPVAGNVSINGTSGAAAPWTPAVSDADGDALTCSIVTGPAHGSASVSNDCSGGTYTADAGFSGTDTFTYRANDGTANSAAATVSAAVTSGSGGGPVALVQEKSVGGSGVSLPVALGAASGSGSALVAAVAVAAGSSASVLGVSDSSGGAWVRGAVGFQSGTNSRVELWYRLAAPSVSSVTVTLSAAKSAAVNVSEWSGVAAVSALDGSAQGGSPTASTVQTPTLATSAADLVIGAVNYPAAATSTLTSGGFASLGDFEFSTKVHGRVAYQITSSAGSSQAAWSLSAASGGSGGVILALRAA
jgi:Big-like domain-containing protein